MTKRLYMVIAASIVSLASASFAIGDTKLEPVRDDLQLRDLVNLATPLGIQFKIFDYDIDEPHCVHFYVDEIKDGGIERHDGRGLCGLAGHQRLTLQWQEDAGRVEFRFMRYRRDIEQGSSVSGPRLSIPVNGGSAEYGIEPPNLEYDQESLLYHGAFGWNDGPRMEFKILAELKRNPTSRIGTE